MTRVMAPHWIAVALVCVWACAKTNDAQDDGSFIPPSSGGTSSANGGSGATGGSAPASGGASTGAIGGSVATGGGSGVGGGETGGAGAAPANGGSGTSVGGATGMAGRPGTGGANGTGGSVATGGGVGTGGVAAGGNGGTAGSAVSGGTGSGGMPAASGGASTGGTLPYDPNFKPPDMTANAKIVVMYTASQTMKSTSNIQFTLNLKNQTDAAYPMGTVTVRYWMSAEPPPSTMLYYSSSNLSCKSAPKFVPNNANSYLEFSFGATGSLPPSTDQNAQNEGTLQGGVQAGQGVNENFNQSNDWSFDGTAAMSKPNEKITVYDGTTLIWGCEPSQVCADTSAPPPTGDAGMGGEASL